MGKRQKYPKLERMERLMAFNVTATSQQRIILAARLKNQTPAAFMREMVEAATEQRLSGLAATDESERATG